MHTHTRLTRAAVRGIAALACLSCVNAYAVKVKVTVENLAHEGGLWFTPAFFGFHDGTFDVFDAGSSASTELQTLAETGSPAGLVGNLTNAATGPMGAIAQVLTGSFGPPGVLYKPGSSESFTVNLDSVYNKYLSYASMIIPSNDAFIGNDSAIDLFDTMGNFVGADFTVLGANIWDAGTEENDGMGAPFSGIGGMSSITMPTGVVSKHAGLDNFLMTPTGSGMDLQYAFGDNTPIARISIRQVPDSTAYIGWLGALAIFGFRFVARKRMGAK